MKSLKLWELDKLTRYKVIEADRQMMPVNAENLIEWDCVGEWVFTTASEIAVTDWLSWDIILNISFEEVTPIENSKEDIVKKLNEIRHTLINGKTDRFTDLELIHKLDQCVGIVNKIG